MGTIDFWIISVEYRASVRLQIEKNRGPDQFQLCFEGVDVDIYLDHLLPTEKSVLRADLLLETSAGVFSFFVYAAIMGAFVRSSVLPIFASGTGPWGARVK